MAVPGAVATGAARRKHHFCRCWDGWGFSFTCWDIVSGCAAASRRHIPSRSLHVQALAAAGFLIVSCEYRRRRGAQWPVQLEDRDDTPLLPTLPVSQRLAGVLVGLTVGLLEVQTDRGSQCLEILI